MSNGDREVICHATAASVSKNRYGITEPLDFVLGENPFSDVFGIRKPAAKVRKVKPEPITNDGDDVDPSDFANEE